MPPLGVDFFGKKSVKTSDDGSSGSDSDGGSGSGSGGDGDKPTPGRKNEDQLKAENRLGSIRLQQYENALTC